MSGVVDVCVVGAGPAGTSLAATLARLGYRVAVVEQRAFPREHIGESLSRGALPLLGSFGVSAAAVEAVGVPVEAAVVRWRCAASDEPVPSGHGNVTVDRGRFDTMLLEHAQAAGADLCLGRVRRPQRTATGWRVPFGQQTIEAKYLADATGRFGLLGGRRTRTAARTMALHARWRSLRSGHPDTLICALPDGWLWCARLPGGSARAMVFVDPATLAAQAAGPDRLFRRLLASTATSAELLRTVPQEVAVEVCDASTYRFEQVVTADSIRVGEAAFTIDPLSSCGIQTAVQTGLAAAATVHTMLSPGGDRPAALEYYADLVSSSVTHHRTTAGRAYAQVIAHADRDFWRRRSMESTPVPAQSFPAPASIAALLPHRVRLRPTAQLRPVACRVGDRIEYRRALCSETLERPVGFLGGLPLAALIDQLQAAPTLHAALRQWQHCLPEGRGRRVLSWLADHDLLEAAEPLIGSTELDAETASAQPRMSLAGRQYGVSATPEAGGRP
jgi:flavin-dependent dehydrogenase